MLLNRHVNSDNVYYTVCNKNAGCIDILVDKGLAIDCYDAENTTPLLCAVRVNNIDVVKKLLNKGARFDLADNDGWFPITVAARDGYNRIVQELLAAGDDPNRRDKYNLWTSLHFCAGDGNLTTAKILLGAAGIDVNAAEKVQWTPLMLAARNGHDELISLLLNAGADRNLRNRDDKDALTIAIGAGKPFAVKALLAAELSLDRKFKNALPDLAVASNDPNAIADTVISEYPHPSHLMFAIAKDNQEIVYTLLDAGLDLSHPDSNGTTALHLATIRSRRYGRNAIIKRYFSRYTRLKRTIADRYC